MKDLDAPARTDFPARVIISMVIAFNEVSQVPDATTATKEEIDAGFDRILANPRLRRVAIQQRERITGGAE